MNLNQTIQLKDGRILGYAQVGDAKGKPVFLFHGLHSSRLEAVIISKQMQENSINLITIDRAGIGLSSFQKERTLFDTVEDIVALADYLNIDTFSVIGTSSGAKYALACAYKIPHRLKKVICLSSGVPIEFLNEDIPRVSRVILQIIQKAPWLIKPLFWLSYERLSQNEQQADTFLGNIVMPLDSIDKDLLFGNGEIKKQFLLQCKESYRQGVAGNAYDARFDMLQNAWGFKLDAIDFPNIHIWHGSKDNGCPLSMAKILEQKIKNVSFNAIEGEGHLTLVFNHIDAVVEKIVHV